MFNMARSMGMLSAYVEDGQDCVGIYKCTKVAR